MISCVIGVIYGQVQSVGAGTAVRVEIFIKIGTSFGISVFVPRERFTCIMEKGVMCAVIN